LTEIRALESGAPVDREPASSGLAESSRRAPQRPIRLFDHDLRHTGAVLAAQTGPQRGARCGQVRASKPCVRAVRWSSAPLPAELFRWCPCVPLLLSSSVSYRRPSVETTEKGGRQVDARPLAMPVDCRSAMSPEVPVGVGSRGRLSNGITVANYPEPATGRGMTHDR
jgi:hypothetical protein